MIEVAGLSKRFGDVQALSDVSFTVQKGKIVGFLGANGAGKTTTMDILCGCSGADTGIAKICGYDVTEQPIEAKRRLGYLPDQAPLHPEMRVEEYITYTARLHKLTGSQLRAKVNEALERLSLTDVRRRIVGNLSKGYRQRVALAQAIVHGPDVLVLDEPTEGLDPNQIVQIRELIRSLAGSHTIILSSHILSEVQNTCEEIIIIHNGRIVQQGTYDQIVTQLEAGRAYRLRVAQGASRLLPTLSQMSALASSRSLGSDDCEIEFSVASSASDAVLDDVARAVVDGGFGLRELAAKTKSLEEVFFQLTK